MCWRSIVGRGLEFKSSVRLQVKEGKRDWARDRVGGKVEMTNLCDQSHQYNLLINVFSTLGCNHCCKNNRPNILIIERYMHNEVGTCTESFWRFGTAKQYCVTKGKIFFGLTFFFCL